MNASSVRQLSSHPRWVASMYEFVTPHWDALVNGPWAESIVSGRLKGAAGIVSACSVGWV